MLKYDTNNIISKLRVLFQVLVFTPVENQYIEVS